MKHDDRGKLYFSVIVGLIKVAAKKPIPFLRFWKYNLCSFDPPDREQFILEAKDRLFGYVYHPHHVEVIDHLGNNPDDVLKLLKSLFNMLLKK